MIKKHFPIFILTFVLAVFYIANIVYYSFPDYKKIYCEDYFAVLGINGKPSRNMTSEDILPLLSEEDIISAANDYIAAKNCMIYFYGAKKVDNTYKQGLFTYIQTKSKDVFFGKKKIGIGSDRTDVENAYGKSYSNYCNYCDNGTLVLFWYDKNDKVSAVRISVPDTDIYENGLE